MNVKKDCYGVLLTMVSLTAFALEDTAIVPINVKKYGNAITITKVGEQKRGMGVFVKGNLLYSVGGRQLFIYDISDPRTPKLLSKINGLGNVRQIVVRKNIAYVAAREFGVWLIDVSSSKHPKIVSRFDSIELATGIDVADEIAFVALRTYGVEIVDISDTRHPKHLALFKTPEAQSVFYYKGKLYVGNWHACEVTVLDVSQPHNPKKISSVKLNGYGDGLAVRDNICYAATGHHARLGNSSSRKNNGHGFDIIDVSNIKTPKIIGNIRFPAFFGRGNDFWTVRLSGNTAFVADSHNGVFIINISNPRKPKGIGHIRLPEVHYSAGKRSDSVSGIAVGNGVVYLTGVRTGLFVAQTPFACTENIDNNVTLKAREPIPYKRIQGFINYDAGGQVRSVTVKKNTAYIAASSAGLHVMKISEKGFSLITKLDIPYAYDVKVAHGLIYVAEGANGIAVYKQDKTKKLHFLGRCLLPNGVFALQIWVPEKSHFAMVSGKGNVLYFVDIKNPEVMKVVFQHRQVGILYGDLVCNELFEQRYVAVNWHSGGIAWYDLKGRVPVLANRIVERLNAHCDGLTSINGKLLMLNMGKYVWLKPNQPGPSKGWPRYEADEPIWGVPSSDGTVVAVSNRAKKTLKVYDFSDHNAARVMPTRRWKFSNPPGTIAFWKGHLVIPLSYQGCLLEKPKK